MAQEQQDELEALKLGVPPTLLAQARQQIAAACSPACMFLEMPGEQGSTFLVSLPRSEVDKLKAVIERLEGIKFLQATGEDKQQLHEWREGIAAAELDF